jgi:recombination protein RecT
MNKQVQQGLTKIDTIRGLLEKMKPEIQKVLPKHLDPARIIRMALTDFQQVRHLNECTAESFLGALMECSQLGLEPGRVLGQAYLLPFKNKMGQYICRMIPGYQGLCAIARRSGEIKAIYARAVCENDDFDYCYGLEEFLSHKPAMGERGELTYVYAVAKLRSDETQFEVMDLSEIEKVRLRSRAADDGPWVTDFVEMAKKTVLKRLCKSLPASVELRQSIALDSVDDKNHVDSSLEEDNFGVLPSPQEIRLIKPVKENADVSFDRSRGRSPEGIDSPSDEYASGNVLSENNPRGSETDIRTEEKKSNQHIETTKKDPKQKEITSLRMDIQNRLFESALNPEHMAELLKDVSLKCKCSMGHMFLTVQDLATCENVAWMKEIADSLGQMK